MNERERRLLYEMLKIARGLLIRMRNAKPTEKNLLLIDFVNQSSQVLGILEDIYSTPGCNNADRV